MSEATGQRSPDARAGLVPKAELSARDEFLAVYDAFVETTAPLIGELKGAGLTHPPDIARALNRRGIPCFGQRRWTGSLVRAVTERGGAPELSS